MSDVYSASGKQVQFEDPNQLAEALLSGDFGYKRNAKVRVYKPEMPDDIYEMPAENIVDAISEGYLPETGFQRSVRDYLSDHDNAIGSLKVGAAEFANSLLFNVPEIIMRETSDPLEFAKINALRDDHEVASLLGAGTGIGANVYSLAKSGALAATEKIAQKSVDAMTRRIMATTGNQVSKAAAERAARGILQKTASRMKRGAGVMAKNTAQGAIEGAIDLSIPASVEALFGNYDAAAETLLLGAGVGGLFGGGIRSLGSGIQGARSAIRGFADTAEESALQDAAFKAAGGFLNRDADALKYVYNNLDDVQNAPTRLQNYDDLDAVKNSEIRIYEDAKGEIKALEDELQALTAQRADEMNELAKAPNRVIADRLEMDVDRAQQWLLDESAAADDILAGTIAGPTIKKSMFTEGLDDAINKLAPSKTPSAADQKTRRSLIELKENIEQLPDFLNGMQARDAMRSLRRDINWNRNFADFDEARNTILKNITGKISNELKFLSPDYKAAMERMAPVAQSLTDMGKIAGTDTARMALAGKLAKQTPAASDQVAMNTMDQFQLATQEIPGLEDLAGVYQQLSKDQVSANLYKKALKRAKAGKKTGAMDEFYKSEFPDYWNFLEKKKDLYKTIESDYELLKPVLKKKTDSLMRRSAVDGKKEEIRRALEFLDERHPGLGNIEKRIRDTNMKEYMEGPAPMGARATLLGGTTGASLGLIGGPLFSALAAGAGAVTGAFVDRYGGRLFKHGAKRMRGLLEAEKQMGRFARKADEIPDRLKNMVEPTPKKRESASRKINATMNQMLLQILSGAREEIRLDEDQKKRLKEGEAIIDRELKIKAWKAMEEWVNQLNDPLIRNELIGSIGHEMIDGGGPNIGVRAMDKMNSAAEYIAQAIPRNPMPPNPFQKKIKWEPSDYELKTFTDKMVTVFDPMIVFDALEAGRLSKNHIDTLTAIYPALSQILKEKVINTMSTPEGIDLDYSDKVALSYILDTPLTPTATGESYAYYQSVLAGGEAEQADEPEDEPEFTASIKTDARELQSFNSRLENA